MDSKRALALSRVDNVAVALEHIKAGDKVSIDVKGGAPISFKSNEEIPFGFKIALTDIPIRCDVIKYGEVIGRATSNIGKGSQVHVHNIEGVRVRTDQRKGGRS